jgi:hypothetical protein
LIDPEQETLETPLTVPKARVAPVAQLAEMVTGAVMVPVE